MSFRRRGRNPQQTRFAVSKRVLCGCGKWNQDAGPLSRRIRGCSMLLRIVLSCLYFVPGALLLHGSLWIATRGKHDFYDVLKVLSLVCLVYIVFVDDEMLNRLLLLPQVLMGTFCEKASASCWWVLLASCLVFMAEISFVYVLPCAWLVRLGRSERLGLKRALYAFLIYCTMLFLVILSCYGVVAMVSGVFFKKEPF